MADFVTAGTQTVEVNGSVLFAATGYIPVIAQI